MPDRRLGIPQEHQRQGRAPNGVISDTLRAYANGCKGDWDIHLPLAEFAINNAASKLGDILTSLFIDRGAHPRLPLSPPHEDSTAGESPAHYAQRMRAMEATMREPELLAAAQAERKAKLDAGRVDSVFKVDRVLLRTNELLDSADMGKLRPRWESDGPFSMTACPNAYTLSLPRKLRCSAKVNVDRLKPFFVRAGMPPAPDPASDAGQEGEHEAELLLNRRMVRGVTRWLTRLPLIFNWRPSFGGSSSFGGGSSSCSGQLQAAGNPMMSCRISTHHLVDKITSGNPAGCSHCSHKPSLPPHERPQLLPTHHGRPSPSSPSASCSWTGYAISTPST